MNEAHIQRYTTKSNARRALAKIGPLARAAHESLLKEDAIGVYFVTADAERAQRAANVKTNSAAVIDAPVTNAPTKAQLELVTELTIPKAAKAVAPVQTKSKAEVRNGVRKPQRGKCADVWAALDAYVAEHNEQPTIVEVKALNEAKGWNINNTTIEFYGWRKFHA